MERFRETGVLTHLCVCFSRDEQESGQPRYVQDNIRLHAGVKLEMQSKIKFWYEGVGAKIMKVSGQRVRPPLPKDPPMNMTYLSQCSQPFKILGFVPTEQKRM